MYPSADQAFNITRETKLATVLNIDNTKRAGKVIDVEQVRIDPTENPDVQNFDVESFFFNAIYVESNAMAVAQVFGLPGYSGVDDYIREKHPEMLSM